MKQTFYKKVGKRYVPVAEYDSEWQDSFTKGHHLVSCRPGVTSRRFNIDPAYAPMIAAGIVAEYAICTAMLDAQEMRPSKVPLTVEQMEAWRTLSKTFKEDSISLHYPSIRECAEAGVKAMREEAEKLMTNAAVKKAYEHFLMVVALTKDERA